jgi:hypothetical protein
LSPARHGDECIIREFFKAEQGTEAPHTSYSFEERVGTPTTAELSVFDKTGNCRSRQYASYILRSKITDGPTVARFVLSGRPSAPKLTDAILLAERVHAALVEMSDSSATFTGCDEEKRPLVGHAHAYILPETVQALGSMSSSPSSALASPATLAGPTLPGASPPSWPSPDPRRA